jgi:thioredoxin 1
LSPVRDIGDDTFEREVLQSERPVVVDFWAPWCGPCHAVTGVLEKLAAEHEGKAEFVKVNVDDNIDTASRYDVLALPTTILFSGGEPRATVTGARPRSDFERAFSHWL